MAAARSGMFPDRLQAEAPRVAEVPFDSNRKRMTTVHRLAPGGTPLDALLAFKGTGHVAFIKGAVDGLLELSTRVWVAERPEPLTDALREQIRATNDSLAQAGMRVLGVAFRPLAAVLLRCRRR